MKKSAVILIFMSFLFLALFGIGMGGIQAHPGTVQPLSTSGIKITFVYKKFSAVYIDNDIITDSHLIKDEIHTRRINADYKEKMELVKKCITAGSSYKNALLYTMPLLHQTVEKVLHAVNEQPKDSKIQFDPDANPMFTLTRERAGRRVDEEDLYQNIFSALKKTPQPRIMVRTLGIPPKITAADNKDITNLRARYATAYTASGDNRKHNIRLALSKLSGSVIGPGQEFSFNKRVGRRSEENGYLFGKIIVGGKYVDGVGGGVCQVSTTLYNAALLSGLKITEVRNHSLECAYEKPSFDAMVNSGSSDLKFVNTGTTPVFLRCYAENDTAVVEFYGKPLNYTVKRISEILYRGQPPEYEVVVDYDYKYHPSDAVSGTSKTVAYSHGELKSRGYLLYYDKNQQLLRRELIREDTYKSVRGLIAIAP